MQMRCVVGIKSVVHLSGSRIHVLPYQLCILAQHVHCRRHYLAGRLS
jgi:hypothetical protein